MRKNLTWLHISDIHFFPKKEWRDNASRSELVEYLRELFDKDASLRPDLLFCTGDIAFGETNYTTLAEQYDLAQDYFNNLLEVCGGLPRERLFVVPGNHDVNRRKINSDAQATLIRWADEAGKYIDHINQRFNDKTPEFYDAVKRLEDYSRFIEDYLPHQFDPNNRQCYATVVDIDGLGVGVAGFNSAWSSAGTEDDRNLWLAAHWQFNNAEKALKNADVRIGLMHHPVDWLNIADRNLANRYIPSGYDFWLHGHSHNAWLEPMQSHIVISAGAVGAQDSDEFGINLTTLDLAASRGETYLHNKKTGIPGWTIAPVNQHAPNGKWFYNLPTRLHKHIHPITNPVVNRELSENEDFIRRNLAKRFDESLRMFSSQPKVWISPIVSTMPETAPEAKSAKQIDLKEIIESPRSIIVKAPPQYGLTCLARFLILEAWQLEQPALWIYLDSRQLKPNNASIDTAIGNELELLGCSENDIKAIVLDSWAGDDKDSLKLITKLCERFKQIPIVCMQQIDGGGFSMNEVNENIREFESLYLWSLERRHIRKFVAAYNESKPVGDEDIVTSRLVSDLDVLNLHRTPLNCLTLLKVSEIDFDESPVNRSEIIKRVLFLIFNLDEIPAYKTRPDLKDCEYLLGYFCELLIKEGSYSFTRDKFLLEAQKFCKENLLDLEVHLVFDVLYKNNILIKIGNYFYFKFSYWIFYFSAQRMHHDKNFADFIFSEMRYAQHPELIEFYTGIDRKREDAIQIIIDDIRACRLQVNANVGFPEKLNPYKYALWQTSPEAQEQMKQVITDGVQESNLPVSIKDQFADQGYDKTRPYDQSVNNFLSEHHFLNMMRIMKAGSRALRNSDYINADLKRQLLSEILACWDQVSKVLLVIMPILAQSKYASYDGAGFILTNQFSDNPEKRLLEILNEIPRNVASWHRDDLYSRKMGPLLIDQLGHKDLSDISRHELIIFLIQQRPRNWEKAVQQYIGTIAKNSFYLFDVYHALRLQYKYGFISSPILKDVERLIKMAATKHLTGEKEPGIKSINKIKFDEDIIPKREFDTPEIP